KICAIKSFQALRCPEAFVCVKFGDEYGNLHLRSWPKRRGQFEAAALQLSSLRVIQMKITQAGYAIKRRTNAPAVLLQYRRLTIFRGMRSKTYSVLKTLRLEEGDARWLAAVAF